MTDLATRALRRNVTEQRAMAFRDVELSATDASTLTFRGYASVTETPYEIEDMFGPYSEVIRAGAFAKTLSDGADVPFKINHDGMTLARTKSGTMRLAEDSTGLYVEADLDPRQGAVRDLQVAMDRGDVDEMSFAFRVIRQVWSPDYDQRDITEVSLHKGDVSVVNYGANPATAGASMRSLDLSSLVRGGYLTPDQVRELEGLPPLEEPAPTPDLSLYGARLRALNP